MVNKNRNQKNKKDKGALKKIIKKNQVVIFTLALMLMTAGYMNYTNNHQNENVLLAQLGDAQLVSTNIVENKIEEDDDKEKEEEDDEENEDNEKPENGEKEINNIKEENNVINETNAEITENIERVQENQVQETASNQTADDYFTKAKLERDSMYSQMLETYNGILENEKIPSDQKKIAENEIKNINDNKNAIMIVENLFESKNFENVVVFINDPSVNVIVKGEKLLPEQVAQIQNIVQRELKTEIENIHISTRK